MQTNISQYPCQKENKSNQCIKVILCILWVFVIASCQSKNQETKLSSNSVPTLQHSTPTPVQWHKVIQDGGFLSGEPCGPPCFWGVTPGITKIDQVYQILDARGLRPYCSKYDDGHGVRGIDCPIWLGFSFAEQTDVIDGVGFTPSITITLKDAINKYGSPSHVLALIGGLPDYPQRVNLSLYYDEIFTILHFLEIEGEVYPLEAASVVQAIDYSDRIAYEEFRNFPFQPWVGYGKYAGTIFP